MPNRPASPGRIRPRPAPLRSAYRARRVVTHHGAEPERSEYQRRKSRYRAQAARICACWLRPSIDPGPPARQRRLFPTPPTLFTPRLFSVAQVGAAISSSAAISPYLRWFHHGVSTLICRLSIGVQPLAVRLIPALSRACPHPARNTNQIFRKSCSGFAPPDCRSRRAAAWAPRITGASSAIAVVATARSGRRRI